METGWTEIFTSGSVTLRCEVKGISAEWNYTWYRDGEQIPLDHPGERLTVRIWNSSYWGQYECRGNRSEKPFYTRTCFKTTNIMVYCILGLAGSVLFSIIMVVLAVKFLKKYMVPCKSKKQLNEGEFYSRVNAEYISADGRSVTYAVYEEIDPSTEGEHTRQGDPSTAPQGSQADSGQHSFYSAVQLKPLNQGPSM
ncbi:hypothetical protein AGOR_G00139940 [Albula goreensis]|uniref:Ig-like domain-containing protein n=1 Tax=Albula goreensis TaxID=1534307 RepID=A0A8T3DEZ2_9TELE|nr:hypothetical protein AGOR_G00139940 [Albula goreensis]